jgi:hypothetical protein
MSDLADWIPDDYPNVVVYDDHTVVTLAHGHGDIIFDGSGNWDRTDFHPHVLKRDTETGTGMALEAQRVGGVIHPSGHYYKGTLTAGERYITFEPFPDTDPRQGWVRDALERKYNQP